MSFYIIKSSGEKQKFNLKKFRRSLRKSGASGKLINTIIYEIQKMRPESTKEIHDFATKMLKKEDRPVAARYSIKRALFELGPAGYPFEEFIEHLFGEQGYKTKVGSIVSGKCVDHEVDIVAHKNKKHYMIECKFHNRSGLKSTVRVTLYIQARFDDIHSAWGAKEKDSKDFHQAWIVTNTQFTSEAHAYADCMDIKLISFSRPAGESLASLIDRFGLHPITALTLLSKKQKRELIDQGCVLCREVDTHKKTLKGLGLSEHKINRIIEEANRICELGEIK